MEKIKLLHSREQSHLEWTKARPEGWKSLDWSVVVSVHREILIHKLTIDFLQRANGKICRESSVQLREQLFLMLCWPKRIMWWLVMTVFLVIICLDERMQCLTDSRACILYCFPSRALRFALTRLYFLWPVVFFVRRLSEIRSRSLWWKGRETDCSKRKPEFEQMHVRTIWFRTYSLIVYKEWCHDLLGWRRCCFFLEHLQVCLL